MGYLKNSRAARANLLRTFKENHEKSMMYYDVFENSSR